MPTPNSNTLAMQLQNTLESSVDKTTRSTLVAFKPPPKP